MLTVSWALTRIRQRAAGALRDPRILSLGMTVGAGWAGRLVTAAAQFIAIRQMSAMLGIDGYGAYAVITGLAGWFALADFGLGASLQNHISARRVASESAAHAIWTTARILSVTTLCVSVVAVAAAFWAGPALLARFPAIPHDEAVAGFAAFAVIASGTGAGAIASRVAFAEHRGYLAHALAAGGAVLGVLGLLVLGQLFVDHRLVWALIVYNLPNLLLPVLYLAWRRFRDPPAGEPRDLAADRTLARELWRRGRMFLLFATLAALVLNVDYVILSQTVAARDVAIYAIFAKIFALVFFIYNSILQAYWPVSAEAMRRGDTAVFTKLIPRTIATGTVIVLGASACLWLFLPWISSILVPRGGLQLPAMLIPLFTVYWIIRIWCDTFGMLIMSADKPLFLCIMIPFQAALNLVFSYAGATYFGLQGLIAGMTLSFVVTGAWAAPLYFRHLLRAVSLDRTSVPM